VRRAVDCIETTAPDCYASFHRATIGALGDHTNTDLPQVGYACFLARAWILDTPPDRLASPEMLDYPRLRVADWYYMSRLAEAIKVYRGWDWRPVGLP
jgi:hypothetical protein